MNSNIHSCEQIESSCQCGQSKVSIKGPILSRFYCHCEVCQQVYQSAHSDFVVLNAKDLTIENSEASQFKKYKRPPALDRGSCTQCHKPTVAFFNVPPFLKLAFIPTANISFSQDAPDVKAHLFYHRRKSDHSDSIPKFNGYLSSQINFFLKLYF